MVVSIFIAHELQDVNEDHDDVQVKLKSTDDVVVHAERVASEGFIRLADLLRVDNQEDRVEAEAEHAVKDANPLQL